MSWRNQVRLGDFMNTMQAYGFVPPSNLQPSKTPAFMKKAATSYQRRKYGLARRIHRLEEGYDREKKTHDYTNLTAQGTTSTITNLSATLQGDDCVDERIGNSIRPKHMQMQLWVTHNPSTTTVQTHRIIVFIDTECDGTYATAAELLESEHYYANFNKDNRRRFRILRDWKIQTHPQRPFATRKAMIKFRKGFRVEYSGSTSAEGDMHKNQVMLLRLSNDNTNKPDHRVTTRMRYIG